MKFAHGVGYLSKCRTDSGLLSLFSCQNLKFALARQGSTESVRLKFPLDSAKIVASAAVRKPGDMAPRPCTEQWLCGLDLKLLLVTPSAPATDQEPRYRCPLKECQYLGATLTHPGDCLRHILDPKVGNRAAHNQLLTNSVVSFRNAEGKPVLSSKPNVPAALLYFEGAGINDGKPQCAYLKVTLYSGPVAWQ